MNQATKNEKQTRTKSVKANPLPLIFCAAFLLIAFLAFFSARWFVNTYGRLGFDSILFTMTASLAGVQSGLVTQYLLKALLPTLCCTAALSAVLVLLSRKIRPGKYQSGSILLHGIAILLAVVIGLGLLIFAAFDVELVDYIVDQFTETELFEHHYVDPDSVTITFPEEKQNLIYIILESMEISYLSTALGGAMEENLIPELYDLARENTSFSHSRNAVGGFYTSAGATWTIGSMVAQTAGIPLKTPTEDVNQYGAEGEAFLPGVTTLMDILDEAGYDQILMVGSYVVFGGRQAYYSQHGVDSIYDVYSAQNDGIIPEDYFVWWGMEDLYLFEYAKQELTEIAAQDQPFAFTMLTVDTHHVGGYQCAYCEESASGEAYDQSISCSSRQVAAFVEWIRQQAFYENTTIVIVGDHESMDNGYFERNVDEDYHRLVYNCFINSAADTVYTTNRKFCAMDLFPTTLAAMGCTIEGNRLGLGTNLYSALPTLTEKLGFEKLNEELGKSSDYYEINFYE